MNNEPTPTSDPGVLPPPSLVRTLRLALRACWDRLGMVCAVSVSVFGGLLLFVTLLLPLGLLPVFAPGTPLFWLINLAALLLAATLLYPLYFGGCCLAHLLLVRTSEAPEEPVYAVLWRGARRGLRQAAGLGFLHMFVTLVLAANILFYLSRKSLPFLVLAVGFGYLLLFWLMNVLYHAPLLAVSLYGVIPAEETPVSAAARTPRLWSVFRNGFLLTASAPLYTLGVLAAALAGTALLVVSGVGAALLLSGFLALLTMQATHAQLARFELMPPPFDPHDPTDDPGWMLPERKKKVP